MLVCKRSVLWFNPDGMMFICPRSEPDYDDTYVNWDPDLAQSSRDVALDPTTKVLLEAPHELINRVLHQ
jgi:hypothetical protein